MSLLPNKPLVHPYYVFWPVVGARSWTGKSWGTGAGQGSRGARSWTGQSWGQELDRAVVGDRSRPGQSWGLGAGQGSHRGQKMGRAGQSWGPGAGRGSRGGQEPARAVAAVGPETHIFDGAITRLHARDVLSGPQSLFSG